MRIKAKLFSLTEPASDGSMIPLRVVQEFLASDEYKNSVSRRTMLGTLTHRARNIQTGTKNLNPGVSKSIGKDDLLLTLDQGSAPTHYIESIEINNGDMWVYATAKILPEVLDDEGNQIIKRLRGLLDSGIKLGLSCVILGFWQSEGKGTDTLKKLVNLKGFDFTMNPSWKDAQVVEIYDDNDEKLFSESETSDEVRVKCFSDLNEVGASDLPKSSKVDGQFTILKAKEFSNINIAELSDNEEQKEFSAATLRERLRYNIPSKFSPRMRLRRLFIDYKQLVKQMGGSEKMDPETLKTLRSLFMSDLNMLMGEITSDIKNGKQIATLLGASSLGVVPRKAAQELQIPYRQAFVELDKTGRISPMRFTKIKEAYTKFLDAIANEVFKSNSPLPDGLEEEAEKEEKGVK